MFCLAWQRKKELFPRFQSRTREEQEIIRNLPSELGKRVDNPPQVCYNIDMSTDDKNSKHLSLLLYKPRFLSRWGIRSTLCPRLLPRSFLGEKENTLPLFIAWLERGIRLA